MKRFIIIILCAILIFSAYSCSDNNKNENTETNLTNILKSYRENGMTSWWDILAVYNADENPLDYKGYDEILASLEESTTTITRATYVLVTNISVIIGADAGYYEQYDNYKASLKNLLKNPDGGTINDYIFAYFALKTSGEAFDETPVCEYLEAAQKADGGFAISGNAGDVDTTAFALPALMLIDSSTRSNAASFLHNSINEDGTFTSWEKANANSTACALSALIGSYGLEDETVKKAQEGLKLFEKSGGYSFLQDDKRNELATAQSAVALGDLKNGTNVWHKLYSESLDAYE